MLVKFPTAICALALCFIATGAGAQTPVRDLDAQRAGMSALGSLHGRWLGQGERFLPDGKTYRFTQTMIIEPRSSGLVLTISGQSLQQGEALEHRPGTGSFAVVSFDERTRAYLLRSFGFGEMVEAKAELIAPNVFRWTTAAGSALLRFTIDLTQPGIWNELGERSGDGGKTWSPTNALVAYRTELR